MYILPEMLHETSSAFCGPFLPSGGFRVVRGGVHPPGSGQQGRMEGGGGGGGGCKNDVYHNSNQLMLRNSVGYH
jgi:hypothetical protein